MKLNFKIDSLSNLRLCIQADIYRNNGDNSSSLLRDILKYLFKKNSSLCFIIRLRICSYLWNRMQSENNIVNVLLFNISKFFYKRQSVRLGYEIDYRSKIGYGLRLPHCGYIVVHKNSVIGNNCELMQGVTIGNNILKSRYDVAKIGNNVILSAGCKIIGGVKIGDNVVVGANAVVNKNFENNVVIGGIPARKIRDLENPIIINSDYE